MSGKTILYICPHPDDLEISCGISIQKFKSLGYKVVAVIVCSGEMAGDPEQREEESRRAGEILGIDLLSFLRYPQFKMLEHRIKIKDDIESLIFEHVPEYIFTPWKEDTHEDHAYISQISLVAGRGVKNIFYYPTPSSLSFLPDTILLGTEAMLNKKVEALRALSTQVNSGRVSEDYPHLISDYWKSFFSHHSRFKLNNLDKKTSSVEVFKVFKQELL